MSATDAEQIAAKTVGSGLLLSFSDYTSNVYRTRVLPWPSTGSGHPESISASAAKQARQSSSHDVADWLLRKRPAIAEIFSGKWLMSGVNNVASFLREFCLTLPSAALELGKQRHGLLKNRIEVD
jgi:hypothetical protein